MRATETYKTLGARAAHYGLIDVQVRALVEMAWMTSWVSSRDCLEIVEQALRLSAKQSDPLTRVLARMSCLVQRLWASGWNLQDAQECRNLMAEIRQAADRRALARHLSDFSFIQWISSEYREAHRSASESLGILFDEETFPSMVYVPTRFILPFSSLFLGEWGEALAEIRAGFSMAEKNLEQHWGQTLPLYQAWVHLTQWTLWASWGSASRCSQSLKSPGEGRGADLP
jgi:hypothetical protein